MDRLGFLTQMVKVFTSTVSFGERANNMVHLLAQHLKMDLALYFGLDKDKAKETLVLTISSQGPVAPHMRLEFPLGTGLAGEVAATRKYRVVHRDQPGIQEDNAELEKLNPAYHTLAAFPVADDNFRYGVLVLMDRTDRGINPAERQSIQLACLMLAGTLRQAIVQEEAKKRIAELSVLFEVGKALSSTMELDEIIERIVSITAKVITARGAALHIVDGATGKIRVSSRYGQIPPECPALLTMPVVEAGSGAPRHFESQSPDLQGRMHYCLAVPLPFKGPLKGTLGVYDKFSPSGDFLPFDPENRLLLFTMAGVVVNAIENAITYQKVEDTAEQNELMVKNLTTIQEVSHILLTTVQEDRLFEIILQGLTHEQGFGFDRAVVMLVDESTQTLKGFKGACRMPGVDNESSLKSLLLSPPEMLSVEDWKIPLSFDQGSIALSVLQNLPYLQPKEESGLSPALEGKYDAQEYFVMPLMVKDKVTGVIIVDNQSSGRPLRSESLAALQTFAPSVNQHLEDIANIEPSTPLSLIHDIEVKLHGHVKNRLKGNFGSHDDSWWVNGIPLPIRQECVQRREADTARDEPYAYIYLIDLKSIIEKNWSLFESDFLKVRKIAKSKKEFLTCLTRLNEIRNRHSHPIRKPELDSKAYKEDLELAQSLKDLMDEFCEK
jgi:GAF domain-containing protein